MNKYSEIAQLAGGLAHEIKNPLSTIRLNVELLAEDLEEIDSPQARRAFRKIEVVERECRRLEELLNDFLNFAGAHRLELQPTDANWLIREIIEFFRPKAEESKIDIIEYLASDLPSVMLDRRSFHQALLNLIINAQQAMPNGGQLVIRTRSGGSEIAVDLIDTGGGMDHETLQHLFDAFFSTKRGGSGLGLATVKKIIEAHGGRIAVQSELNYGTQFTIILPCLPRLPTG
ncbi:MAG: two-component sensor histidine kinase [Planctomycetaceae bacterium]|jgi:signal transduction histidine kinase|nr:two-component sensor histidine kinase [Planctomycetaceae bacterium]